MSLYLETLTKMETIFSLLHSKIEKPEKVKIESRSVFRYKNKTPDIAIIQYMAREISGLYSAKLLIENGFIQECNVLYRTLDEFNQNILFLSIALIDDKTTKLQQEFLDNFFQEEFDNPRSAFHSTQKRALVPRDKIRAFLSNRDENPVNPSDAQKNYETIDKFYSGFIHGTSVSIIDMYCSTPSMYDLKGSPPEAPSANIAKKYFEDYLYRAIFSLAIIAISFKEEEISKKILDLRYDFESKTGRDKYEDPNVIITRIKQK